MLNKLLPKVLIIGSAGRCGQGVITLLEKLDINYTGWDKEQTAPGGPFKEILNYDILANTVLLKDPIPPFLVASMLEEKKNLSFIADISCDPNNPGNPLPIYSHITSWEKPFSNISSNTHLLAIDNLPSVLPKESSEDYSEQLFPYLEAFLLNKSDEGLIPWASAKEVFLKKILNF